MKRFALGLICLVVAAGCDWPPSIGSVSDSMQVSMNVQRAVLNSGGQVATAALLDRTPLVEVDRRILDTKAIVAEIRKFIDTGKVGEITMGQLQAGLNKIVPLEYSIYSNQIVAAVSGFVKLPTDKLGTNNIVRITEVLDGIDLRCDVYDKTARVSDRGMTPQLRTSNEAVKITVK